MNEFILDNFLYSVNDIDFYMKVFRIGKGYEKIKISKNEFLNWCKSLEDDEQGYEMSEYAGFYE